MVNQQIIDWIKSQESWGYTTQQIRSYLIQQGHDLKEIDEALNLVSPSSEKINQPIQPIKSPIKILPFLIIGVVFLAVIGGGIFYFISKNNKELSDSDLNSNNNILNEEISTEITNNSTLPQEPSEVELDINCDAFPDKLNSCSNYKCQFTHPITGELMEKEILGIIGNKCNYIEQMSNGGKMECKYTESMRKAVTQYYKDVAAAESVGTEINTNLGSGETEVKYTIDGKEVSSPLSEAMTNGQCIISGY